MKTKELEEKIGVKIEDKQLFSKAFTHRSYLNEDPKINESNEKLEFLGDSIISFVVANYLFRNYPNLSEGDYTDIRAHLVSGETLGKVAKNLKLGKFLKLSKGEEKVGGREKTSILADTYEALVGAIFLQSGLKSAEEFVKRTLINPYLLPMVKNKTYLSPKTLLQEYFQKQKHQLPKYEILKTEGPEHKKVYTIGVFFDQKKLAEGKGRSKKKAEEKAAEKALEKIKSNQLEI